MYIYKCFNCNIQLNRSVKDPIPLASYGVTVKAANTIIMTVNIHE